MERSPSLIPGSLRGPPWAPRFQSLGFALPPRSLVCEAIGSSFAVGAIASWAGKQNLQDL